MRITIEDAVRLDESGKHQEATALLDAILFKNRDEPYLLLCAANNMLHRGWMGIAFHLYNRVIQMAPNEPFTQMAWANLGVCLRSTNDVSGAESCFTHALRFCQTATGFSNLACIHINNGTPEKAKEYSEKALKLDPEHHPAGTNLAIANLELGNYEEGWKTYDSRLETKDGGKRHYYCPMWDGSFTDTLVVNGEQGVGDEIMFGSLIERCKPLCNKLILECHRHLVETYQRSFEVGCYATEKEVKEKESPTAYIPVGSLPRLFGVFSPIRHTGYLRADYDKVQKWKNLFPGRRIGVSWRGGTAKTHDYLRNFDLEIWKKLTDGRDMISLQYDDFENEAEVLGLRPARPYGFDDHMALVNACDLVVSICNTTVHMAGSMGIPCICIVPSKPAWRYGLTGEKMFWYDSVRMIRQKPDEGWNEVMDRVEVELHG